MARANGYLDQVVLPSMPRRPVVHVILENLPDPDLHHELKIVQKVLLNPKAIATLEDKGAKLRKRLSDLEAEIARRSTLKQATTSTSPTATESTSVDEKIDAMIKRSSDLTKKKFVPAWPGPSKSSKAGRIDKTKDDSDTIPDEGSSEIRNRPSAFKHDEALYQGRHVSSPIKQMSLTESMAQCKLEGTREVAREKKAEESKGSKSVGKASRDLKENGVPFYSRYAVLPKQDVEDLESDGTLSDDSMDVEVEEEEDNESENGAKEEV